MNREQTLLAALRFATAYVQKAVADGLMEDCAVPASVALERLRAVLDGQEGADAQLFANAPELLRICEALLARMSKAADGNAEHHFKSWSTLTVRFQEEEVTALRDIIRKVRQG
jgi:hypothetical protein